jgi:hypothetical protein
MKGPGSTFIFILIGWPRVESESAMFDPDLRVFMYAQGQFTPRAGSAKSVSGERAVSIILMTLVKNKKYSHYGRMHMH